MPGAASSLSGGYMGHLVGRGAARGGGLLLLSAIASRAGEAREPWMRLGIIARSVPPFPQSLMDIPV